MKDFIVYSLSGEILRCGTAPASVFELQAGEGEHVLEGKADPSNDVVDVASGVLVPGGRQQPVVPAPAEPVKPPDYVLARMAAYPTVVEQLDMLWHAMDAYQIPRAEPFFSQIKSVKEAHPKGMVLNGAEPQRGSFTAEEEEL